LEKSIDLVAPYKLPPLVLHHRYILAHGKLLFGEVVLELLAVSDLLRSRRVKLAELCAEQEGAGRL
jgi:hypothetical protein